MISSVQSLSRVRLFVTPWIAARQASLSITNFKSKLQQTEYVMYKTKERTFTSAKENIKYLE